MSKEQISSSRSELLASYKSRIVQGPLNGKIILGFCYYLAGPIALQNLVNLGALVIKVENEERGGDPTRQVFSKEMFNAISYGQLSLSLNYSCVSDMHILIRLLHIVDAVIDNRSVDARERDQPLQEIFISTSRLVPLIYCTISGFPNSSKYRFSGLDASGQAISGMAYTNCASQQKPMKVGFPVLDQVTGLLAANQVLANLLYLQRKSTSHHELSVIRISVSLVGTAIWLQTGQVIKALEGDEYFRSGNEDQFAAPFSYYTASDGLISIATVNEAQFSKFCSDVLEDSDFQKKFPTIKYRIDNQSDFESELNKKLKTQTREYWSEKCVKYGIPSAPVLTVMESIRNSFVKDELISASKGGCVIVSAGITNSIFAESKHASAPELGQDKDGIRAAIASKKLVSRL